MTISRSNFSDLLAPGLRKIFVDALNFGEKPPVMNSVFNVLSSTRQYEDDSYVTGFGLVPDKDEGTAVTYDDFYQGYDKRYTHTTRSLAYRITKEMNEDEMYGIIKKMPAALGRSMRATVETDAANVLNRAETAGYEGGGDSVVLLSTSHTMVTGGTQKNRLTTAADLSATSWEQANIDIKDTTDDRGILLNLQPSKLIFPNELAWTVKKLFGSEKDPDSANNAINPASGDSVKKIEWNYLTDPDAWFVLCTEHELNWFWRVKPDHYQGNDFDTDDAKFKVRARWSNGWTVPYGIFGSMGG